MMATSLMVAGRRIAVTAALLVVAALGAGGEGRAQPTIETEKATVRVVTVADGLAHPWGLAFLPDGGMLVTERPGRLRRISADGRMSAPLANVPPVFARGQGGLLDVALDPAFADNRLIYLSYAEPGAGGLAGTAVARGRLADGVLEHVEVIFRQQPKVAGHNHWGSRLVFADDGNLFVTLGERFQMERAQKLDEHLGKLVRIRADGGVPADNPFFARDEARPEIYSLGHRNVQGATLHPQTRRLWIVDHGPRGGDEINLPDAGRNYGWPIVTYGVDYSGRPIGEGTAKPGLEPPIHYWDPSIAPSGMAFYTGDAVPAWRGNLFVGSLKFRLLVRLEVNGAAITHEERLLEPLRERIRDVRDGPDGHLYLLTDDADGRLLRLDPVAR